MDNKAKLKQTFHLEKKQISIFKSLSDENAGILIKAVFDYEIYEKTLETNNELLNMCFTILKSHLDNNNERYNLACEEKGKRSKLNWEKKKLETKDDKEVEKTGSEIALEKRKKKMEEARNGN